MAFLTPDKTRVEHGLTIKEKIIPWGAKWPKDYKKYKQGDQYKADRKLSGGTGKVEYITIHNTEDIKEANGTNDAEQYARAVWPNANMGDVRVHYFIDETDCWQQLREDEVGWHAADGRGPGNETTIAIEIIMDGSGSVADLAAEDRGALLAAILLNRHGLGIDRLTTHKHWCGKQCPIYILPHWELFKAKVESYLKQIQGAGKPAPDPAPSKVLYRVQIGAFKVKAYADNLAAKLKGKGFDTYIVQAGDLYRVQVGAYSQKANAEAMLAKVKAAGFTDAFITTNTSPTADATPAKALAIGDTVKLANGAPVYGKSTGFASWVYTSTLYVREIKGDRVVISTLKSGAITGAVDKKYLTKI